MIEQLASENVVLGDGDVVNIYRPFSSGMFGGYSCVYRNEGTRAIDELFGLDGSYVLKDQPMADLLRSSVSDGSLENSQVESTLGYFMELTIDTWGVIVGVDENQLALQWMRDESLRKKIYINESLEYGNLVRKNINGDNVLFPVNIFPRAN